MMTRYFVTFNAKDAGRPISELYSDARGHPPPPADAIEISEADGKLLSGSSGFSEYGLDAANKLVALPALLDNLKQKAMARVNAIAAERRELAAGDASPWEMASWPVKRAEAAAFAASKAAADAPNLGAEAAARGVALDALAAKVSSKAAALLDAEAKIAGTAGKHADAIAALQTVDEVNAYDFMTGWPI